MGNKKHKCALCCNKTATWKMESSPNKIRVKYLCQDCLPKKLINGYSFSYSIDGFDIKNNDNNYFINYEDCLECLDKTTNILTLTDEFLVQDKFCEIFLDFKNKNYPNLANYNIVMSKFGDYMVSTCGKIYDIETVEKHRKFYINFKRILNKKKTLMNFT